VKAAVAGDNQPGPMPGKPAPPDSHRARGVAVGAGLLAAGLLGRKHIAGAVKSQSQLATSLATNAAKQRRAAQGQGILKAMKSGDPAATRVAAKWQQMNKQPIAPSTGDKARALAGHYKQRVQARVTDAKMKAIGSGSSRDAGHERFWQRVGGKPDGGAAPAAKKPGVGKRLARGAVVGGVLAGAAVAGASGASKAREPQSDDQPGLR
jgi:hypothetical protein